MTTRNFFLWLHRWAGLAMAAFLILVGLTGSVIAFRPQINRLIAPQYHATSQPGAPRLDFAALTDLAEALVPHEQVFWIVNFPDQIRISFSPRRDPATGKPYAHEVEYLYLDPWTGRELRRDRPGAPDPEAFINTTIYLHEALCLGMPGLTFMGIVALIWTVDCFVAFYLTLPATLQRFWPRWKVAWLVKWRASAARVHFDLHRASGLWLWPLFFLFAWSGVLFNLPGVYHRVSDPILKYVPAVAESMSMTPPGKEHPPTIDFRTALSTGRRLLDELGRIRGFTTGQAEVFQYEPAERKYFYSAKTSRDIFDRESGTFTYITFDSDTGALRALALPTGEHIGNTVYTWLIGLHEVWVFGLPYHILVAMLGLAVAVVSYTGIYIWLRKRRGRILAAGKPQWPVRHFAASTASQPSIRLEKYERSTGIEEQ